MKVTNYHMLHYMILNTSGGAKNVRPRQENKGPFCINHQPISPTTKTIEAHICSATNPTAPPRRLKMAPATLPTIAFNASTAFSVSLLSASANLSNNFFKAPLFFDGGPPVPPPPPKSPTTESAIVVIAAKRAGSVEIIICS